MSDFDPHELVLIGLLSAARDLVRDELNGGLAAAGYEEIRDGHGCVFGNIAADGSRLTDLAERSGLTKQAVGEAVADLERMGYVERSPDPTDGRAKIIRLTERGEDAQAVGTGILEDIEARWGERFGAERVGIVRELLADVIAAERAPAATA